MAASKKKVVIVGLLMAIAITGSEGQEICGMNAGGLNACKPSVSGQKPQVPPSSDCCQALKKANLQCLCGYKNSGLLRNFNIDPDQAMALPAECHMVDPSWHC